MCVTYDCNPQISYCHFFLHSLNFSGSTSNKAYRHWIACKSNPYSVSMICFKCCQGLKMCIEFGCISQTFVVTFLQSYLSHFSS